MNKIGVLSIVFLSCLLALPVHALARSDDAPLVQGVEHPELEKARHYYNTGRYEEAIRILKVYVAKRPIPDAYYMLAYSLYKLGRHDEANKYFKQAFLLEPGYSPTPELEKKLDRPLDVARPGPVTGARVPAGATTIPKLLEKRPGPVVGPAPEEKAEVPPPPPAEAPPPPPEITLEKPEVEEPKPVSLPEPAEVPSAPSEAPVPGETVPPPPEVPAPPPVAPGTAEVPPPPSPAPPEAPGEISPEKQMLEKASEQLSKAADELMVGGKKLSRGAEKLQGRPEIAELKRLLEQTDPQVMRKVLGVSLFLYLFLSFCLYRIAKKLRVSAPLLAFVPIVQIWTFIRAADKSVLPSLLLLLVIIFVPLLNIVAAVYVWMGITYNMGRNKWLALLILVPGINFLFVIFLAFARIRRRAPAEKDLLEVPDKSVEPPLPDLGFDLEEEGQTDMSADAWSEDPFKD